MDYDLIPANCGAPTAAFRLPRIIHRAGPQTARRFVEFFAANIRNRGTREVYARAVARTTKLYDRTGDAISLDDIERIVI